MIIGKSFLHLWDSAQIAAFTPLIDLALGIIGFMIGGELKFDTMKKRGRSINAILLAEGLVTFAVVAAVVTLVTGKAYLGILLGALASATAPAATVDVLWEYKSRGPLTSTLLAIVALDDVLALLIYAFAGLVARGMIIHEAFSFGHIFNAFGEIALGMAIGTVGGLVLYWLIHFVRERQRILPFSLGIIALTVGVAEHFHIDLILSSMLIGLTLANIAPVESSEIFEAIKKASTPIYVLFFVLVGARLDLALFMSSGIAVLALVYVLSRTAGKLSGSFLGGLIGKAPPTVTKYLGFCLFSQAGVAIGLAISINNNLSHYGPHAAEIGHLIVNVIVATTFIVQMIGPPCVKYGIFKAGEAWKNITEDDIINSYQVADLIEKDVPIIRENTPLNTMVEQIKNCESQDFCVVDDGGRLLGSLSIGDLRDVLLEQEIGLTRLVMARDIAVPATRMIAADRPLKEAIDILRRKDLDFLPVVEDAKSRKLVGLIHYKMVMSEINKELLSRRGSDAGQEL